MANHKEIISQFRNKNILVVGDIILDRYIYGNVSRISPEAPVPVVLEEKFFYVPGGAANVSHNLSSLECNVVQVGRIGNDFEGKLLKRELKRKRINTAGIFVDKNVPTITKTRVIAQNQQVVRIDREKIDGKKSSIFQQKVSDFIEKNMDKVDAVIISDYGKGLVTSELVSFVCKLALEKKKIITVDPKVEHFGYYRKVTAITPNKKEAENAIRNIKIREKKGALLNINVDKLEKIGDINTAGKQLLDYLKLESVLITLGEGGMRLFEKGKIPFAIKTRVREVYDVSGAGDTVISVFTLSLTVGASKRQAAELSNFAAGIVVGKMGAVAVTREELIEAVS